MLDSFTVITLRNALKMVNSPGLPGLEPDNQSRTVPSTALEELIY